jgi:hypothetical protein
MDSKLEVFGKSHTEEWHTLLQTISEGYFRVLRIPFKMGRAFSEAEISDAKKSGGGEQRRSYPLSFAVKIRWGVESTWPGWKPLRIR